MVRHIATILLGALLLAASPFMAGNVNAQSQADAPLVEESYATAVVRDVLTAVNHGNWTGNYTVLRDYASPDFALTNDPTRLAGLFTQLRAQRLDLLPVLVTDPVLLRTDLAEQQSQMRLTGYFPLQPQHVSFDLTFEREGSRWLLLAISVGAFDPIEPGEAE
ncbi:hypothetical protein J7376_11975 [Paracoccus sp. R12_1]|uniref:hypothetical protein n=1 Tax=Paracoccus sp. TaxID=267 RepID=UPI001B0E3F88|nr:hypothetical protein [Paracoccus sp. R12_1]